MLLGVEESIKDGSGDLAIKRGQVTGVISEAKSADALRNIGGKVEIPTPGSFRVTNVNGNVIDTEPDLLVNLGGVERIIEVKTRGTFDLAQETLLVNMAKGPPERTPTVLSVSNSIKKSSFPNLRQKGVDVIDLNGKSSKPLSC